MAEANNLYGLFPHRPQDGEITYRPIATGQTLAKGDPVILSGGQIAVAVANSSTALWGVVAQDCVSLTAGTMVAVWEKPGAEFVGRAAAATAETIGAGYDLSGSTGVFEINNSASTQHVLLCLGTWEGDTAATDCRRLVVTINFAHSSRVTV